MKSTAQMTSESAEKAGCIAGNCFENRANSDHRFADMLRWHANGIPARPKVGAQIR